MICNIKIAPKTIINISRALIAPAPIAPIIHLKGIFQAVTAIIIAANQPKGIALVAGQLYLTIIINTSTIGITANIADTLKFIILPLHKLFLILNIFTKKSNYKLISIKSPTLPLVYLFNRLYF